MECVLFARVLHWSVARSSSAVEPVAVLVLLVLILFSCANSAALHVFTVRDCIAPVSIRLKVTLLFSPAPVDRWSSCSLTHAVRARNISSETSCSDCRLLFSLLSTLLTVILSIRFAKLAPFYCSLYMIKLTIDPNIGFFGLYQTASRDKGFCFRLGRLE